MKKIDPADLVCMDNFTKVEPIAIDLVYAKPEHPQNMFRQAIYHDRAKLWLHKDLAAITIEAGRRLRQHFNYTLVLKDGLRTYEAQTAIWETEIMKAHPEWAEQNLFALPGQGAHPRGMAIDVSVVASNGQEVDMGTPFDHMDAHTASRSCPDFDKQILQNRNDLENAFISAAIDLNLPLLPLPSEWWDFRMPTDLFSGHAHLTDAELPAEMRMTLKY